MSTMLKGAAAALTLAAGASLALAQDSAPQTTASGAGAVAVLDAKSISLAEAFPQVQAARTRTFRARKIELAPGARTELMDHAGRPAITYVTQGRVREHRVGAAQPVMHDVGAATMDRASVTHYWENAGDRPAILLIVDIIPS